MRSIRSKLFDRMDQAERSARVRRIIGQELTELQRYTLTAYYFQKKSLSQIARERNVNVSTVSRTLHRAEEKLRRFLQY